MTKRASFEWDIPKADSNRRKHRVSFEDMTAVVTDPKCVTVDTTRVEDGEYRSKAIGMIEGRLFTIVFAMRGETRRLISARRSNRSEENFYASHGD